MNTVRLFSHHIHVKYLLLAIGQWLLASGSVYVALKLRYIMQDTMVLVAPLETLGRSMIFGFVMVIGLGAMGLYRVQRELVGTAMWARIVAGLVLGMLLAIVLYYLVPQLFVGRGVMAIAWMLTLAGVGLSQHLFGRVANQSGDLWRVLFYGAGHNAAELLSFMRRRTDHTSFRLAGCVVLDGEPAAVDPAMQCTVEGSLVDYARAHDINEIVVAMDDRRRNFPADELIAARMGGINIVDMVTFYERQTGRVKTELLQPSWLIFSHGFRQGSVDHLIKRIVDLASAGVMMALLWPVMLLAALAIKLEDGPLAPVLYRQTRTGYQGRVFRIVKFRSMRTDAEQVGGAQWATDNDPRITRVGHYLRKLRVDELPQLWNVLRGDMSLVGPRPERPEFVDRLVEVVPYYRVRECVRPGITGWAQLGYPYGASEADANAKLQFDLYYVKNWSLFLDLLILCNTVEVVLFRKGSR